MYELVVCLLLNMGPSIPGDRTYCTWEDRPTLERCQMDADKYAEQAEISLVAYCAEKFDCVHPRPVKRLYLDEQKI